MIGQKYPTSNSSPYSNRMILQHKILQDAGYQVISMRECAWKKMKTNLHIVSFLKNLKTGTPKRQLSFQKILEKIEDESLFGLAIVDIHTPEELKPDKNLTISLSSLKIL